MANNKMTICKSCGEEIASSAKSCPKCGAKNKKPIYKRVWFLVIIAVLTISAPISSGNKTEAPAEETKDTIILKAGEAGEFGKAIVMSEGTDMHEDLIVYYIPAGDYTVKNIGEFRTQVSVYGGFARNESTGYDEYTEVGDTPSIDVNETANITVPEGWFIEIHEPAVVELVAK